MKKTFCDMCAKGIDDLPFTKITIEQFEVRAKIDVCGDCYKKLYDVITSRGVKSYGLHQVKPL